eukprot:CAMPEP_0170565642 /NCGR_PEP_ID=MMETSP0211-20121228/79323_1 /TAXON_ID=311385 /ORGANISM="Pseudokeronopsis sp., Strain OXSARD2" /LENGTH=113 /DNA_ID=CAMNT_0010886579 /DNA_START=513 /DNA_END=858 /DNA_ORIENTATION=-
MRQMKNGLEQLNAIKVWYSEDDEFIQLPSIKQHPIISEVLEKEEKESEVVLEEIEDKELTNFEDFYKENEELVDLVIEEEVNRRCGLKEAEFMKQLAVIGESLKVLKEKYFRD